MALVLADRVRETTTSTGSGTITLAGTEPGYQSFSAIGNGNQTYYVIAGDTEWEVGIGTYTASGTTLSRDTVLSSSASGAKVTFSAGNKRVFVSYPSEKSVNFNVSGDITAATGRIINLGAPSLNSDAATKEYVDNMTTAALHVHEAVVLATPASSGRNDTYNNGTAGVSATLTATANGTLTIDSTVAQAAQRVLIKDCDDQAENGIYVVTTVGNGSTAYVMTRASDADTYGEQGAESLDEGSYFFVTGGTSLKGAAFVCNTAGTITFGTTPITFGEFSQAQVYSAGNGISLTATTISLASPVVVSNGGTGLTTTPTNGQLLIGNGTNYTLSTLMAGSGVSITNSAGSITLSATGLGGTVTAVTATGPLASSGGTTPDISIANSTGTGSVVLENSPSIFSATITAALSASITTITGSSANITTVTGTTTTFSSGTISQLGATSATVTTLSGTNVTYSSGTVSQLAATSATIATVSGTNATYSNGNFTSATVTTVSGTTLNYASATLGNLWASSTISAGTTSTTGRVNANEKGFTPSNTDVTKAAIVTSGSYGGGVVMNDGGIGAIWMQAAGTEMGIGVGTTSGVANAITVRNGGATIGSLTVTTLTGTSANITTLTGTTFGTTATTQLRGASAQITNISATSITVTNTPAFVGNGTLTMNVSGTGLSGSQTFTANQSGNATFTVTSNATSANTGSTIVARDGSGNFSAGTITATLNGNASTATSATSASTAAALTATTWQRIVGNTINYGSYGSIGVTGTTNSYAGISFSDVTGTLMMNFAASGFYYSNSTWRVYWDASGNQLNTGNVTAYSSDKRLKKNIQTIENPFSILQSINGVYFDWDTEECAKWHFHPPAKDAGVLAQDVQKVFPYAVHPAPFDRDPLSSTGSKSGKDYLTVQYEKLVPLLIEAIKELKAEVEALKRK